MVNSSIEPELNSLLSKLTVEIENDQKEIDLRTKRIKKNEALLHAVRGSLGVASPSNKDSGYGTKSETVKAAISKITKPRFTQDDVENEIQRQNPNAIVNRDRVRATLWSLANQRKELIKQVKQGNNQQAAEFEKLAATNGNHELKVAK